MHLILVLLMGAVLPALAQFESLSTPYDGSRLYFTSRLRQSGTDQPSWGKMFLADSQGIRPLLVEERVWTATPSWGRAAGTSNYYDVFGAEISSGETRLAAMTRRDCVGSTGLCGYSDQTWTRVYNERGQEAAAFQGGLRLSPNGRWGLVTAGRNVPFPELRVIDLETQTTYDIAWSYNVGTYDYRKGAIANNGTAVAVGRELTVFRPPDQSQIIPAQAESAAIDAAGTVIVWADKAGSSRGLRVLRLEGAAEPVSLTLAGRDDYLPSMANDGSLILFLSRPIESNRAQVFLVKPDGSSRRQLSNEPEGISNAILSGNGAVAWVLTRTGRLLRIDVSSGNSTQIIGAVPAILDTTDQSAKGNDVTLAASVLGSESLAVDVCGQSLPVSQVSEGAVSFRLPFAWSIPPALAGTQNYCSAGLWTAEPSTWEGGTVRVVAAAADSSFVALPDTPYSLAAHQNWHAVVTEEDPAAPGEILHFYATEFGRVTPPVPNGAVAPLSPLSFLETTIDCYQLDQHDLPAERLAIYFAGLAPGTIGYYQISLRLPDNLRSPATRVLCAARDYPASSSIYAVATIPTRADAAP